MESRGRILDVTLPYQKVSIGQLTQYYLGRYIFVNGALKGIRLASSKADAYQNFSGSKMMKWARGVKEVIPVPLEVSFAQNGSAGLPGLR